MKEKEYVIAVRSYQRADTIQNKTLRVLEQDNIYIYMSVAMK